MYDVCIYSKIGYRCICLMTIIIMMIAAAAAAWYNIVYECSELEKLWGLRTPALTARRAGRFGSIFPSFLQCTF